MSPNEVEQMYLDRAEALIEYWADYPPPHILVRGAVGYERGSKPAREELDLKALREKFGGARGVR